MFGVLASSRYEGKIDNSPALFLCFSSLCPQFREHPVEYYIEEARRLKHIADAMVSLGPVLEMLTSSRVQSRSLPAWDKIQWLT